MKQLAALLLATGLAGAEPYANPVMPYRDAELADPYVLRFNGEYYLYASGDPIQAFHSRDLSHWEPIGPVLRSTPGGWNEADVWAPEVIYRNGKFLMYYTAARKSSDWRVGEMSRRIGVAVSDSPRGPFQDVGHPVSPNWGIDGHVYTDRSGQDWLFYSSLQEPAHPGAGIAVDRLVRFDQTANQPVMALQGSLDWEDKDGDPHNGSVRYTNEGPTVLEREGQLYLFYSGGSWDRPNYAVGYATARQPQGPWIKVSEPVLRATPLVDGPGHNALTRAPNGLDDVHVYHARLQPYLDPWNRMPFFDRLHWNGDRPSLAQPSLGLQAPFEQPLFSDYFDGPALAGWMTESGTSRLADGTLHVEWPSVIASRARLDGPGRMEINLRTGGVAGLDPVLLDARQRVLRSGSQVLWALPADFRCDVFHQLVLQDGEVRLDGVSRGRVSSPGTALRLRVQSGSADFDGAFLSGGYTGPPALPESGATGLVTQREGPVGTRYEFAVTLRPHDTSPALVERPGPSDEKWWAGVMAGGEVRAGFDKAIWPFARLRIWNGARPLEAGLPRGFDYSSFHTLRVLRDGDAFTFFVDGQETLAARFPMGPSQPGYFSQDVATTFSSISYKPLVAEGNLLLNAGIECETSDPWKLDGAVRLNESSAHTGVRRLLWTGPVGTASQRLALAPAHYRLHAFLIGSGSTLRVKAGGAEVRVPARESWQHAVLEFAGQGETSVELVGEKGLAVDDVWLERLGAATNVRP